MKITLGVLIIFALGYIVARYVPAPGNAIGLP